MIVVYILDMQLLDMLKVEYEHQHPINIIWRSGKAKKIMHIYQIDHIYPFYILFFFG